MATKIYKPNKLRRFGHSVFRVTVLSCFALGVSITAYAIYGLGKYYIFDKPAIKKQQREYAEALLRKEKRERELGLRD